MDYKIREIRESEYPILSDFLYEEYIMICRL